MSDNTTVTIELFGPDEAIASVLADFDDFKPCFEDDLAPTQYIAEYLVNNGEKPLLYVLRERAIAYVVFFEGDFEYEPRLEMFIAELGEWSGPSTAVGDPLVAAHSIDRILEQIPEELDQAWLRNELEELSAKPWREHFTQLRSARHPLCANTTEVR